jgi:uncharacterized repeat protein (TIGR03803 family)
MVFALLGVSETRSQVQTFTLLASFVGANDAPYDSLVQGYDGNFYGTTSGGSPSGSSGAVFKITPSGQITTLYPFCSQTNCIDGAAPTGGLVLGADGNFYGTTSSGGAFGGGEVFKITARGVLTVLHSFKGADGDTPYAALVQGIDGNFYGTTNTGGTNQYGTVFKITPSGTVTTLYNFCSQTNCADGAQPLYSGILFGINGDLYGTTEFGGTSNNPNCLSGIGCGTVFRITPTGKLTVLYSFCSQPNCTDGSIPQWGLVHATDGNFYGTTLEGGSAVSSNGSVFKITPNGVLTTLYDFCSSGSCFDGANPTARLVQGTDGSLYGTTAFGGNGQSRGTIFEVTLAGALNTLYSFCSQTNCNDGSNPHAGLMQATNGKFYGTTVYGGTNSDGTLFSLSTGLGTFVVTQPTSGTMGTNVVILGNKLSGATKVTFNGTPASFTVVSNTEITTTVPEAATSGRVQVVTANRTLRSNVQFRVLQ